MQKVRANMDRFYIWIALLLLVAAFAFNPYSSFSRSCGIHKLAFDVTTPPAHQLIDKNLGIKMLDISSDFMDKT